MLSISASALCRLCGVAYPETKPSIGDLLSSLSADDTQKCHGTMISVFGFPPSVSTGADSSLKSSIRTVQEFLRNFAADLSLLLFEYVNINWGGVDSENWWWTEVHSTALESLRVEDREKVSGARLNLKYLMLIGYGPDENLRQRFQQIIITCLNNLLGAGRSDQINDSLRLLFSLHRVKTGDDFLIEVINRMLLAFIPKPELVSSSLETKAVRSLLIAIIDRDLAGAESALEEVGLPRPNRKAHKCPSNDSAQQIESWQSIFEKQFNVEVDWWRNKDTF